MLQDKVALVTGGATGIGEASARALSAAGAKVAIADIDAEQGEAVAESIRSSGREASFFAADCTSESSVKQLIERTLTTYGRLDCAHNNIGSGDRRLTIENMSVERWDWTFDICLKSVWLAMKYEIPVMVAQGGGSIVNTASMSGLVIDTDVSPAYCAAKAGVIHLTRYAAAAHGAQGVRVNSISPGATATPAVRAALSESDLRQLAAAAQIIPRATEPSEVADTVVYLCSGKSQMITGTNLEIAGGRL